VLWQAKSVELFFIYFVFGIKTLFFIFGWKKKCENKHISGDLKNEAFYASEKTAELDDVLSRFSF
jgi:hypothetical protein